MSVIVLTTQFQTGGQQAGGAPADEEVGCQCLAEHSIGVP
jgi:hypothetical protein